MSRTMEPTSVLEAAPLAAGGVTATLGALALALALARGLRSRRRRQCLLRVHRSCIAGSPGGPTRVRGRVQVLTPASGSLQSAAYAGLEVCWNGRRRTPLAPFPTLTLKRRHACGRFVVSDGTGLAIVRPGAFELLVGEALPAPPSWRVVHLLDGMEVELAGYAARVEATLDPLSTVGDFDACLPTLRFDGSEDAPVIFWVRGAAS